MAIDNSQHLVFDHALIRRYDQPGPRYTSYPTAPHFGEDFDEKALQAALNDSNASGRPLSLYFHIPFCEHLCFYCACTKVVTRHHEWGTPYVAHLDQEMALTREHIDGRRPVDQLHFGGGTPTFLRRGDIAFLLDSIGKHFHLLPDDQGEYGIEIDPRALEPGTLRLLRDFGFNRISIGVQDLDAAVQKAVHREQSFALTASIIDEARQLGFRSVSLDLIYGLPLQTPESFAQTLEAVLTLRPDRLSVFNYAHLPDRFPPQKRILDTDIPSPDMKLRILAESIATLQQAGYLYIGMDHFALPDDELAIAQREGSLYRNFQGYSTHAGTDLLAFGMSAIAMVGTTYSQTIKDLDTWGATLDSGHLPVERGLRLSAEDLLRRHIITRLICDFSLDFNALNRQFSLEFHQHFAAILPALKAMSNDGLLQINAHALTVTPQGRLLIRHICMAFDAYLAQKTVHYSRVI
ncbi:Oxygen-independent coproporphyrinogen-III oxidase [Acidithiobacillus ferrivorans]|uniref:Coproporphyrinogen-III oxidase n=1 Tax=Acidithiobacillus ferrivorans TaxID=160808 RepID=A0A060UT20_9PROT|nr:oxygen-independent coproporphyrinogen III oxidase [Acidithiobacillus ferrivorans]CDQ11530.1 Oxygen-independent coproporphyrinogen-III oxidase [Acidithiobacillus ferrivorans]SMH66190.1 Oxygen-independent coproporphyrinogen-III oxidase [Acidithiobacillus ferrivorans]